MTTYCRWAKRLYKVGIALQKESMLWWKRLSRGWGAGNGQWTLHLLLMFYLCKMLKLWEGRRDKGASIRGGIQCRQTNFGQTLFRIRQLLLEVENLPYLGFCLRSHPHRQIANNFLPILKLCLKYTLSATAIFVQSRSLLFQVRLQPSHSVSFFFYTVWEEYPSKQTVRFSGYCSR